MYDLQTQGPAAQYGGSAVAANSGEPTDFSHLLNQSPPMVTAVDPPIPHSSGMASSPAQPDWMDMSATANTVQDFLARDRSKQTAWDDTPLEIPLMQQAQTAPPQYAQYAQEPQPAQPDFAPFLQRMQMLEAENQDLAVRARAADMFREMVRENPEAVRGYSSSGTEHREAPGAWQTPGGDGQGAASPDRAIDTAVREATFARFMAEALDLERQHPGAFDRKAVARYAKQNGFTSLYPAFKQMVGEGVLQLHTAHQTQQRALAAQQQQQAYQQQVAAAQEAQYRQYQQMMEAQRAYQPQPEYPQHQQYGPVAQAPVIAPPPAPAAVVGRPGARLPMGEDGVPRARSWNDVQRNAQRMAESYGIRT